MPTPGLPAVVQLEEQDGLEDGRVPLLQASSSQGAPAGPEAVVVGGSCTVVGAAANLVTTAVGAGMVALPRAVSETGVLAGMALFAFTAALTFASTSIIVRYSSQWRVHSYSDLVRLHFGPAGATALQLAILAHVGGVMIGYNVIIADIMLGAAPHFGGMLPTLLGRHDNPWWLSRAPVLGVLMVAVVGPMLAPRDLTSVARFSRCSVGMVMCLAASIFGLAAVALLQGQLAPDVRLLPEPAAMGGTPLGIATSLLTVVSVSCLAFTCQFNLLPVKASLREPSCAVMLRVARLAIAVCTVIYATVAISGYGLFGGATDGDVLKNLTVDAVSAFVPPSFARVLIYGISVAFTGNLLVNFVLKVWAARDSVCELAFGRPALQLGAASFYAVTVLLVAAAYGIACAVPSVYALLALVGSTACVTFSYVFPSLLVVRCRKGVAVRSGATLMLLFSALVAGLALFNGLTGWGAG